MLRKPTRLRRPRTPAGVRAWRPFLEGLEVRVVPANVDVLSYHNDPFLTGQNLQETDLTPATVNATAFGRLASQAVDGYVYAQPLYKAGLAIAGGTHNVVFVATEHDSVYAFDADNLTPYWHDSFINPAAGVTTVPNGDVGSGDIVPEIGITGAPVIDGVTNTLYVVAKTKESRSDGNHWVQRLHALDLATGAEKYGGPYTIGDSKGDGFANQTSVIQVAGAGADSSGGQIRFNALREHQRPSLQLLDGRVYVAWASHGDNGPYHGWVVGFNETTLQPEKWFNTSPNARGVGIWQSEGALSTDGTYLYFAVGNGFNGPDPAFDPPNGNYSESVIKLSEAGTGTAMTVASYFTPHDWQSLDTSDADLGSGGVMLLPDDVGSSTHTHLMVETGKSGKIYLIDRDNLGGYDPNTDNVVQEVTAGPGGVWGNPAFYLANPGAVGLGSGYIYYHGSGSDTRSFRITNGLITPAGVYARSNQTFGFPGAQPTITADGAMNDTAIDWELQEDAYGRQGPAILHAYAAIGNAQNVLTELYNSNQTSLRDQLAGAVKFATPTISNGHVYVGSEYRFDLFGLYPTHTMPPDAPMGLAAMPRSDTSIRLTWTNPTPNNATEIKVERSAAGPNGPWTQVAIVGPTDTVYDDTGLMPSTHYWYRVRATNQVGDSPYSNVADAFTTFPAPVLHTENVCSNAVQLAWTGGATDRYEIQRSADGGNTFTTIAVVAPDQTTYTDTSVANNTQYLYRVEAFATGDPNPSVSNVVQAQIGPAQIDYFNGFPQDPLDLHANGAAQFAETTARLTNANAQAGSVFSTDPRNIVHWTTTFKVRLHEGTQPNYADGFTFVLQADSPGMLGQGGGGLGYQGIPNSVAIKFDTFNNEGEHNDMTDGGSTGFFYGGDRPTVPHSGFPGEVNIALNQSEVNLESQSTKTITLSYDAATQDLHEEIIDADHPTTPFEYDYMMVNLPALLGSSLGYVGFTGSTGDMNYWELQDITGWRYTPIGPAAPRNLRVTDTTNGVTLVWNCSSADEDGFTIERATSPNGPFTPVAQVGAGVTTYTDNAATPGTYYYRVQSFNVTEGSSGYSNVAVAWLGPDRTVIDHSTGFADNGDLKANGSTKFQPGGPVGDFLNHQDIGTGNDPGTPGSASFANGTYTLTASGSDIWGTADHMQYVYRPLTGDGEIVARAVSVSHADFWTKAGLMIRGDLAAGAPDAFMLETPPPDHAEPVFQWRTAAGGDTADSGNHMNNIQAPPVWLRLVRSGNSFSGYWAQDLGNGEHGPWNQMGTTQVIPMGTVVYVGLGLTAHNNSAVATATFDNVSLTGDTSGTSQPTVARLTDGGTGEAASFFSNARVPVVAPWRNTFTLQIHGVTGTADGVTFTIQNDPRGASALGASGGGLGYQGIVNSVAVYFDIYSGGSHHSTTGLFVNGTPDRSGAIDLSGTRINLASNDPLQVELDYDGSSVLTERIRDTVTGLSWSHDYKVDVRATVGSDVAYVGFTGATGGESAVQDVVTWTADFATPAVHFVVTGFPAMTTAGEAHTFTVTAAFPDGSPDPAYTGTVHFTSSDPQANLPPDYTFTAADNGTHVFGAALQTAGQQSITASDVSGEAAPGTQTVMVNPAAAVALALAPFPSPVLSGMPANFTVTAVDRFGNTGAMYTGTVHFTSSDPQASLPPDYTFTPADQGTHTFSATLYTVGTQSLTVADTTDPNLTATQGDIVVTPAAFVVSGYPSPVGAGQVGTFTVTAVDGNGNVVTNYTGTVHFSSSDPQALLPADYTFTPEDQGTYTFPAVLKTAGSQTISATDVGFNALTGNQSGIIVTPSPVLGSVVVQGFPSPIQAGTPGTFTVTAYDIYGNVATGYTGTVTFSSSDPLAQLPDAYTFTGDDMGTHTFTATLFTAGPQSITATDVDTGVSGTQDGILVTPGAAAYLVVSGYPSPVTAGTLNMFTVTAYDAWGNAGAVYTGTVTFSSSDPLANLPTDYTFQPGDNGTHDFYAVFNTPGTQSLTATDTQDPTITGTQGGIEVVSGPGAAGGGWNGGPVGDFTGALARTETARFSTADQSGTVASSASIPAASNAENTQPSASAGDGAEPLARAIPVSQGMNQTSTQVVDLLFGSWDDNPAGLAL